jgi:GDP-L-fucose synthase
VFLMNHYSDALHINVGTGEDLMIRELAEMIRDVVYPAAVIRLDSSKPDGAPRKLLDIGRIKSLGWQPRIALRDGIQSTYEWFLSHHAQLRIGDPERIPVS